MAFEPIENYGVIGNMQSIALVGMNGSIDFLCYPNFDSPTVLRRSSTMTGAADLRFELNSGICGYVSFIYPIQIFCLRAFLPRKA
jgi:GH15 family glucan-1,4-alpha-glucosidase